VVAGGEGGVVAERAGIHPLTRFALLSGAERAGTHPLTRFALLSGTEQVRTHFGVVIDTVEADIFDGVEVQVAPLSPTEQSKGTDRGTLVALVPTRLRPRT
jgi:hypothetical protein